MTHYRELLVSISQDPRKTRARRLAESGLMFWDAMMDEKRKAHDSPPNAPVSDGANVNQS